MREALEPCPFCKQSANLHENDWCVPSEYGVHCSNVKKCGASTGGFQNETNAIRAWNRRAALSTKQEGEGSAAAAAPLESNKSSTAALLSASPDDYWRRIVAEIDAAGKNCRFAVLLNHQAAHLLAWAIIARNAALNVPPAPALPDWMHPEAAAAAVSHMGIDVTYADKVAYLEVIRLYHNHLRRILTNKQEGFVAGAEPGRSAVIRASEHPSSPASPTPEERENAILEKAAKVADRYYQNAERIKRESIAFRSVPAFNDATSRMSDAAACARDIRALKQAADVAGEDSSLA